MPYVSGKSYTVRMATIGWTDAARRAGARLATTATSIDRGADDVSQGFHVAERDAHVFAIEADEGGRENDSDDHAGQHEFHDVEQDHAEHAASRGAQRDAHRKLARTCRDHQSDDAVNSKRRERQDDAACDTRDGRLRQEVIHAVLPQPHSRDHLGISRRSIFSRSETAVLRIEIARRVFKRRGHFLWRFARHAARNQEQLLRRLLRERQQQLLSRRSSFARWGNRR